MAERIVRIDGPQIMEILESEAPTWFPNTNLVWTKCSSRIMIGGHEVDLDTMAIEFYDVEPDEPTT